MVSVEEIKKLREQSGAGMMDCKRALEASEGDFDKAIEHLRLSGLHAADKKSTRAANDGLVGVMIKNDNKLACIIELNCETDFVSKNDKFHAVISSILDFYSNNLECDIESFMKKQINSVTVEDYISASVATIGENISLKRIGHLKVERGHIFSYIHNQVVPNMGKIGVIIAIESDASYDALKQFGRQIGMHIAASKPIVASVDKLDKNLLDEKKQVFTEECAGKPENLIPQMVDGKMKKYYKEVVLLEQPFVMDNKLSIAAVVEEKGKELGCAVKITDFKVFFIEKVE